MKILIAAKCPPLGRNPIGGVQTWSTTVGAELTRRGHDVHYWGPEFGTIKETYDIGILANLEYTENALHACRKALKVSHGIIPAERGDVDFVATSEEVAERWGCELGVIRQPIDLDYWSPGKSSRTLLVRHSYRQGLPWLEDVARQHGLKYARTGKLKPDAVRDMLRRAAVVVATGRAAVEAMACGASVVIADDRPYQGALLDPDPFTAMLRNYSGRGGEDATQESVAYAVRQSLFGGGMRSFAEFHHDVKNITDEVLEIC